MNPVDVVLILCTVPPERAREVADPLLQEGLAACVNFVGPIRSRYVWQGAIAEGEETLLLIKTRRPLAAAVRARVVELHPYEVPEVLEFAAAGGLPAYLDWVLASTRQAL